MFRFSIREILLCTLVVAVSLGWWLDRTRRWTAEKRESQFWENLADTFQSFIELEGHTVEVGEEKFISVKYKDKDLMWSSTGHTGLKYFEKQNPKIYWRYSKTVRQPDE